jgi:xanthine dehydrogenase accessory factor
VIDLYREIHSRLQRTDRLALATIVSSTGSTPLPPGAKMLVEEGAAIPFGTIGGGPVEADVCQEARKLLAAGGKSLIRRFTPSEDESGCEMLCGGILDVLIEEIWIDESFLYSALVQRRESGRDSGLVTLLGPEQTKKGKFVLSLEETGVDAQGISALIRAAEEIPDSFAKAVTEALGRETVVRLPCRNGELIIEAVIGMRDLVIFGGGHVSKYVARSAAMAGFRVTVVDDRPEYANPERFPEAYKTLAVGFDHSWDQLQIKSSSSIVIVTRGHTFDERILERAVGTPARYIGMIGSKRKVLATYENLVRRGISRDVLNKVRAPIGLEIGAVTAEEIGISITAELIAVRRGISVAGSAMVDRIAEFFRSST